MASEHSSPEPAPVNEASTSTDPVSEAASSQTPASETSAAASQRCGEARTKPLHAQNSSTESIRLLATRSKSSSMSFPLSVNTASLHKHSPSYSVPGNNVVSSLPAPNPPPTIPPANDSNFLTALAAQERQVLELKEQLSKAEQNLIKFKKQWVAHEARKRQSEGSRLQQLQSMKTDSPRPPPAPPNGVASPQTVDSMYQEMQKRKASLGSNHERSPRRRFFEGSRHTKTLSLVSPLALERYGEASRPLNVSAKPRALEHQVITESPASLPPTPELDNEDDAVPPDQDESAKRASHKSQRDRVVRSSMQMASDFREGLWTFFEDLKQATYGEEARASEAPQKRSAHHDADSSDANKVSNAAKSPAKRPNKHTVRRQTWQFRPRETKMNEATGLSDTGTSFWKDPVPEEKKPEEDDEATKPAPAESFSQRITLHARDFDGETWDTWDTPTENMSPTKSSSPVSPGHTFDSTTPPTSTDSSADFTQRPAIIIEQGSPSKDPPRRESMAWPTLNKLVSKPAQLRQTASNLMDEWERSLKDSSRPRTARSARSASPRPKSPRLLAKRSNSRLDETYT